MTSTGGSAAMGQWPGVRIERRAWRTHPEARGPDGQRANRADRMLNSIDAEIPAAIGHLSPALRPATLDVVDAAAATCSALERRAHELGGLGDLLVRTEAVASSKIEHVYADLDDIARASIGAGAGDKARRTVAAAQALRSLSASVDEGELLSEAAILAAHHALLHDDVMDGTWAGRYREQQNWIGGSDISPRTAVHVPPPPELVPGLMADLVGFANRRDLHPVAQAAIVHAQFEAIHPFVDGNGRVGRALIGAVTRRRRLTPAVTVPVAAAMLADVDTYVDRLAAYRAGDVDAMVGYVASSTVAACEAAEVSADRLATLPSEWHERAPSRAGSSARRLVDGLLRHPILDIGRAEAVTGSTRIRTYEALDRLVEAGVLDEITGAGRNRIWVAVDVMDELRELEDRIGVRATPSKRFR